MTPAARSERGRERAEAAARRARKRKPRSDLSARVIAAVPAIAVALFLVLEGGPREVGPQLVTEDEL